MKKEDKDSRSSRRLERLFAANSTYYLVDFKQMKVSQSVELRKILRKNAYPYKVVKNRLALRALGEKCPEALQALLPEADGHRLRRQGPHRAGQDRSRTSPTRGRSWPSRPASSRASTWPAERFDEIVRLTSRDELLGKVGYMMATRSTELLRTLQAPLGNMGPAQRAVKKRKYT